ncbi:MAG: type II secretion system F family protein [Lachnospiraceae bacterium]|nr:type II secretion system F family protein [Lachnospiraceae bacterium]
MTESLKRLVSGCRPEPADWPIFVKGAGILVLLAWFFYRSPIAVLFLSPLFFPFFAREKKERRRKHARELGIQFRDAILSVSTNQKAGYSVENAFREAYGDMTLLYGKNSRIVKELSRIGKGLANNVTLEKLLLDMGERSGNTDILEFALVFAAAKRSGGNMTRIMADTAEEIGERLTVENEIDVLISAKKMEARIMDVVPFFIIFYVGITSPGFFDPLYHNLTGIVVMSVCLAVYIAAYLLSERIIAVEV